MVNVRVGGGLSSRAERAPGRRWRTTARSARRLPELSTATTGTSVFGAGLGNSAVTPLSPYCHVAYGVLTQFEGLVDLPRPEGGSPVVGDRSEQARSDARRQLRGAQRRTSRRRSAAALGERDERDGEPGRTRDDVRRSHQPARFPDVEDLAASAGGRTMVAAGHLQRAELERGVDLQHRVRSRRTWLQPLTILTPRGFRNHRRDGFLKPMPRALADALFRLLIAAIVAGTVFRRASCRPRTRSRCSCCTRTAATRASSRWATENCREFSTTAIPPASTTTRNSSTRTGLPKPTTSRPSRISCG